MFFLWGVHTLMAFDPTEEEDGQSSQEVPGTHGGRNTVRLASANVTSLKGNWDLLVDMRF